MPKFTITISLFSFLISLMVFIYVRYYSGGTGLLIILTLILALAVHEAAHIFCSRLMGYPATRLRLSPLGGSLQLSPLFEMNPEAEWIISAAGPFANLLMVVGVSYLRLLGVTNHYLNFWFGINLMMAVINLLPAWPLDGGRMIHAWLNHRWGLKAATSCLRISGFIMGILFAIYGGLMLWRRQGGVFFIIMAAFMIGRTGTLKPPRFEQYWQLLRHKEQLLTRKGQIDIRSVLVSPETEVRRALQQCGGEAYLLFCLRHPDGGVKVIDETKAWTAMVTQGATIKFGEVRLDPSG